MESDGGFRGPLGVTPSGPLRIKSCQRMRHDGGHTLQSQDHCEGLRALPLNRVECARFHSSCARCQRRSVYRVYFQCLCDFGTAFAVFCALRPHGALSLLALRSSHCVDFCWCQNAARKGLPSLYRCGPWRRCWRPWPVSACLTYLPSLRSPCPNNRRSPMGSVASLCCSLLVRALLHVQQGHIL